MSNTDRDYLAAQDMTVRPWDDSIVAEVRAERDRYAAAFAYDIDRIFEDARRREQADTRAVVTLMPRRADATA